MVVLDGDGLDASATDRPTGQTTVAYIDALKSQVNDLHDQVSFLRSELVTRNEELRRKDHIIAALTERIPELEPPSEPRESPVTASDGPGSTGDQKKRSAPGGVGCSMPRGV